MSARNDAEFLRMFLLILGGLVVFTVLILIAANVVTGSVEEARGEDPRLRAAIAERIGPIGRVRVAGAPAAEAEAAAAAAPKSGADIVAGACNACHLAGVLESPKTGDKDAWTQRLAAAGSVDALTSSVINGKGQMPARGGAQASDDELRAAVEHMLSEAGVDVGAAAQAAPAPAEATAAPESSGAAQPEPAQQVAMATPVAAATPAGYDLAKGKNVYDTACFACHLAGAAGAPLLGDQALWAPRIAQGMDTLIHSVLNGKGAMPPKGGRLDLADDDVEAAVAYMVAEAQ